MGLDLRLLPFDAEMFRLSYSHTVLSCEREYELFDAIIKVERQQGRVVPANFSTFVSRDDKYEETHYGNTQETPYGEKVRELEVESLLVFEPKHWKNKAIWVYLRELQPRTKVALFWH